MNNKTFNVQQCETTEKSKGWCEVPGSCRITRSDESADVVVQRGVVGSIFSSVLTWQGNTGEQTACKQNPQAGRAVANTKLHSPYGNLRQSRRGTEVLATQANHRRIATKFTGEPR